MIEITIHIPAAEPLTAAINNLADAVRVGLGAPVQPVKAEPVQPEPAEKPRRQRKADNPKEVEEKTGRRVEGVPLKTRPDTPETQAEDRETEQEHAAEVATEPTDAEHVWTLKEIKETFIDPYAPDKDSPADHPGRALMAEMKAARKKYSNQSLTTVPESDYPALVEDFKTILASHGIQVEGGEG